MMAPRDVSLAIMAKSPEPGRVKTRLIPQLSPTAAAALYELFLRHLIDRVGNMSWGEVTLWHDPPHAEAAMRRLIGGLATIELRPQHGNGLGPRLVHAAQTNLRSRPHILFLGVDSPDLPIQRLSEAADLLQNNDLSIGPCDDGGFWTIGMRRGVDPARLFAEIEFSSGCECNQTVAAAARLGYKVGFAGRWDDIDRPADLWRLIGRLRRSNDARDKRLLDGLIGILPPDWGMESKSS